MFFWLILKYAFGRFSTDKCLYTTTQQDFCDVEGGIPLGCGVSLESFFPVCLLQYLAKKIFEKASYHNLWVKYKG